MSNIYALQDHRWNAAGTTFNGIQLNIDNGAAGAAVGAAASRVLKLTNNGSLVFDITPAGIVEFSSGTGFGQLFPGVNNAGIGGNGFVGLAVNENVTVNGTYLPADRILGWSSSVASASLPNTADTILQRDAANTLALRNGINPQIFNIYNTFTSSVNYERVEVKFAGNVFSILALQAGAGAQRPVKIGGNPLTLMYNSAGTYLDAWQVTGGGHFTAEGGDNTFDIGQSSSQRARNLYVASNIHTQNDTGSYFLGAADDTILTRDAANTFAIRNGTNAQAFNIYNTFTDVNNYERFNFSWNATEFFIQGQHAGTGSARNLRIFGETLVEYNCFFGVGGGHWFYASGNAWFGIATNSGNGWKWFLDVSTGNFLAGADNTFDIGASGATRPRNIYIAGFENLGVFTWGSVSNSITAAEGMILGCSTAATVAAGATVASSGTGHTMLYFDGTQWKSCA